LLEANDQSGAVQHDINPETRWSSSATTVPATADGCN
jgi:hypothetical protein